VQAVEVMHKQEQKWNWLNQHIVEFTSGGSVLIFVTKKTNSEELAKNLKERGHPRMRQTFFLQLLFSHHSLTFLFLQHFCFKKRIRLKSVICERNFYF